MRMTKHETLTILPFQGFRRSLIPKRQSPAEMIDSLLESEDSPSLGSRMSDGDHIILTRCTLQGVNPEKHFCLRIAAQVPA